MPRIIDLTDLEITEKDFMDYDKHLDNQFKDLAINLVRHDTSPTGLPCYIEVHLGKTPKDKGALVLDLGNYIYRRFGLKYQMTPEYRGKGKKTTVRWFMSWQDIRPIRQNIWEAVRGCNHERDSSVDSLPSGFTSLIIQNTSRGVSPQQQEVA